MNRSVVIKSIAGCAVLALLLTTPVQATIGPVSLQVHVDNVDTRGGPVRVAVFDRERWLSPRALAGVQAAAREPRITVDVSAPHSGRFALAVYQDVNNDGRLNRNIVGLPTEPVGFSNGAAIRFGPPSFDAAAVEVGAHGATISVRLR